MLVRDLNPDNRFVPNGPAVMPGRNRANITGSKFLFFPVIHTGPQSARNKDTGDGLSGSFRASGWVLSALTTATRVRT
jgi:hypothetical protein